MSKIIIKKIKDDLKELRQRVEKRKRETKYAREKAVNIDFSFLPMTPEANSAFNNIKSDIIIWEQTILGLIEKGIDHNENILRQLVWDVISDIIGDVSEQSEDEDYESLGILKRILQKAGHAWDSLTDEGKKIVHKLNDVHNVYSFIDKMFILDGDVHSDKIICVENFRKEIIFELKSVGILMVSSIQTIRSDLEKKSGFPRGIQISLAYLVSTTGRIAKFLPQSNQYKAQIDTSHALRVEISHLIQSSK